MSIDWDFFAKGIARAGEQFGSTVSGLQQRKRDMEDYLTKINKQNELETGRMKTEADLQADRDRAQHEFRVAEIGEQFNKEKGIKEYENKYEESKDMFLGSSDLGNLVVSGLMPTAQLEHKIAALHATDLIRKVKAREALSPQDMEFMKTLPPGGQVAISQAIGQNKLVREKMDIERENARSMGGYRAAMTENRSDAIDVQMEHNIMSQLNQSNKELTAIQAKLADPEAQPMFTAYPQSRKELEDAYDRIIEEQAAWADYGKRKLGDTFNYPVGSKRGAAGGGEKTGPRTKELTDKNGNKQTFTEGVPVETKAGWIIFDFDANKARLATKDEVAKAKAPKKGK